jgi:m7GpppX diphosphatase
MSDVESCPKKTKLDTTPSQLEAVVANAQWTEPKTILNDFRFVQVLNEDSMTKSIFVHAKKIKDLKNGNKENASEPPNDADDEAEDAVIIFGKSNFSLDETKSFLELRNQLELHIDNDTYKKLSMFPAKPHNSVQVTLIFPATASDIKKYSKQEMFLVEESYDDWLQIFSKVVNVDSAPSLKWVYNILEHKSEIERIVFEDADPENGFILVPDMKWDEKNVQNLYLQAIVHTKNISCLRDLNGSHIGLLENMRDKSLAAIEAKYSIKPSKLRCYLHYHPTFYHLHVHISHINYHPPGMPEKNYLLSNVIENLRIDSDYFKKVKMEIIVKKNDKLFEIFAERIQQD